MSPLFSLSRTEKSFSCPLLFSLLLFLPPHFTLSILQSWSWILLTPLSPTLVNRELSSVPLPLLFFPSLPIPTSLLKLFYLSLIDSAWNLVGDKFSKRANETLKTLITFVEVRRLSLFVAPTCSTELTSPSSSRSIGRVPSR